MTVSRFPRPITPLVHPSPGRSRFRWRPGALVVAALVALLVASPALAALRVGTKNAETLTGTTGKDHLTGAEGNDLLKGLAGNDTYFFADNWGVDELVEKPDEGTDTLNFRGVRTSPIEVRLVREWDPTFTTMYAQGPGGNIDFSTAAGQATIEKVIGGHGDGDLIETGSGPHTLQPGGGAHDELYDDGGYDDGPGGFPAVPVSNDVFKGFGDNTGTDLVVDFGGSGDVVDLRPFSTNDVYISRRDFDSRGTEESLQIVTGPNSQVILIGHFDEFLEYTSLAGQQGRIEKLIFADATFTSASGLAAATASSGKQAELADAADQLAKEAQTLLAKSDAVVAGGGGSDVKPGPRSGKDTDSAKAETDTQQRKDTRGTQQQQDTRGTQQDMQEKRQGKRGNQQENMRQREP